MIGGSSIPDIRPLDLQDPGLFRLNQAIRILAEHISAIYDLPTYSSNADAEAGGLKPGWLYRTPNGGIRIMESADRSASVYDLPTYANNLAAANAGLKTGWLYKTAGGEVRVVV